MESSKEKKVFSEGQLVCHKDLEFNNGIQDPCQNRPCVVLFSFQYNEEDYVCICPLTDKARKFNRRQYKYLLIPEIVCHSNKLSFAQIEDVTFCNVNELYPKGARLGKISVSQIKDKILDFNYQGKKQKEYETIQKVILYANLFDELEEYTEEKEKVMTLYASHY